MFRRTLLAAMVAAGPALAQPTVVPDCAVAVALGSDLEADVTYRCRSPTSLTFQAGDRAGPFVAGLKVETANGLTEAHYRFDIAGFARAVDSTSLAVLRGKSALLGLGAWLLEPRGYDRTPVIDIRVATPPGMVFATGLPKVGDAWRLSGTPLRFAGFSVLGNVTYRELAVPAPGSLREGNGPQNGVLRLAILEGIGETGTADLLDWVARTAEAESHYWQGFTAERALLALVPTDTRRGVGFGRAESGGGVSVMVEVGRDVDRRLLFNDWVLVHELIHTGMPYIRGRGSWLMEGAATYVEPIIRARAGWKSEEEVWREWLDNMPHGVAGFSHGLSRTSGRDVYWSGAIFMLLADLGIRRESNGAKGLENCLRGILWNGLDGTQWTTVTDYAAACDRVTGTHAMSALVERRYDKAEAIDLDALWKELGVSLVGGRVALDDSAPSARWRKLIVPGVLPPRRIKLPWES
ncbi:MAG: hypothetical protein JO339_05145 [Alphaproteobacteria bacterium]|nr:hypothetical protein [Alphaproteobacteria bacterium]